MLHISIVKKVSIFEIRYNFIFFHQVYAKKAKHFVTGECLTIFWGEKIMLAVLNAQI